MGKKLKKIVKASITHVSLVPKGANGIDFLIIKGEGAPTVAADVPILKVNEEQRIVTGVVYEPNVPDSQGDFMEADTIEKTAYAFMENYQNIDIKHDFKTNDQLKVIESYITKSEETIGNKKVQPGTWVMSVKVNDDTVWEGVKKGDFNGFSMGGTGVKEEVQIEETPTSIIKDKKGIIAILKRLLKCEDIKKISEYLEEEPLTKAGKKISAVNEEKLRVAYQSIGELLSDIDESQIEKEESEEVDMKKQEFIEAMKEVVAPINERLTKLEKGESNNEQQEERLTKQEFIEAMKEVVTSINERLDILEKSRGISNQLQSSNIQNVQKSKEEPIFKGCL